VEDLSLEQLRLLAAAAARCEASAGTRERIWEVLELLLDGQTPSDLDAVLRRCPAGLPCSATASEVGVDSWR
jgi:hypothetical protein